MVAFKRNGRGLDVLAREVHAAGHFFCPEGSDLGEYLLTALRHRLASLHADLSAVYDAALERHYRELHEASVYAERTGV